MKTFLLLSTILCFLCIFSIETARSKQRKVSERKLLNVKDTPNSIPDNDLKSDFSKQIFKSTEQMAFVTSSKTHPVKQTVTKQSAAIEVKTFDHQEISQSRFEALLNRIISYRNEIIFEISFSKPIVLHPSLAHFVSELYAKIAGSNSRFTLEMQDHLISLVFANIVRRNSDFSIQTQTILCDNFAGIKCHLEQLIMTMFAPGLSNNCTTITCIHKGKNVEVKVEALLNESSVTRSTLFWKSFNEKCGRMFQLKLLRLPLLKDHIVNEHEIVPYFRDQEIFDVFCNLFFPLDRIIFRSDMHLVKSTMLLFLSDPVTIDILERYNPFFYSQSYNYFSIQDFKHFFSNTTLLLKFQGLLRKEISLLIVFHLANPIVIKKFNQLLNLRVKKMALHEFVFDFFLSENFIKCFEICYPKIRYDILKNACAFFDTNLSSLGVENRTQYFASYLDCNFSAGKRQTFPIIFLSRPSSLAANYSNLVGAVAKNNFFQDILSNDSIENCALVALLITTNQPKLKSMQEIINLILVKLPFVDFFAKNENIAPLDSFVKDFVKIFESEEYKEFVKEIQGLYLEFRLSFDTLEKDEQVDTISQFTKSVITILLRDKETAAIFVIPSHKKLQKDRNNRKLFTQIKHDSLKLFSYLFLLLKSCIVENFKRLKELLVRQRSNQEKAKKIRLK